ncbi:ribosome silencing factor [Malikia spinosa]|uniref:Ribosomal silencing factor RsfS n=2 Tax=Malikia spinosa TaxID=86180 RepID=A0A7C9IYL3_9BURK|nr:ribosome silencing factor [Malikia spinosa]MYZ53032.1 ribosome silencing factor [Malikia spinosa]
MSETADKKKIQKLQRAIVDGLEDVKALDIQVFNTEGLSPLFERVIVASGSTNRQTRALAASVRDAVREAGFEKPRTEGEENGEWIIVDCGQAVVHVMQPTIRQYYRLEDLWGDVPVRLKSNEARGKAARAAAEKSNAASARKAGIKPGAAAVEAEAVSPAAAAKKATRAARKSADSVATTAAEEPKKAPVRKAAKTVKTGGGSAVPAAKKAPARKAAAKKVQVVKIGAPVKKPVPKRAAAPKKA